jgi:hypothetical protein
VPVRKVGQPVHGPALTEAGLHQFVHRVRSTPSAAGCIV